MNSKEREILKDDCITVFTVFFSLSFFLSSFATFSPFERGDESERKKILYTTINRIDPANSYNIYLRLFIRKFSLFESVGWNGKKNSQRRLISNFRFHESIIFTIFPFAKVWLKHQSFFLLASKFSFRMDLISSIEITSEREFSSFRPSHPSFLSTQTDDIKVWNLTRWHGEKFSTTINRNPPPLPLHNFFSTNRSSHFAIFFFFAGESLRETPIPPSPPSPPSPFLFRSARNSKFLPPLPPTLPPSCSNEY